MDRMERFFKIDKLLRSHRSISRDKFLETLEVSLATFKRDLEYLRDRMHAPIEYDREINGYRYKEGEEFNLPGLWLNASEIHALLTMQHLLGDIQPGILDEHINPLMLRIQALLEMGDHSFNEINQRIKLLSMANRPVNLDYFETITSAVLTRKQLNITYYTRAVDNETQRIISPQRLVHYRDNWYLDAWCHLREEIRCFAVESIRAAHTLDKAADNIDEALLEKELGTGYGIFTGSEVTTAVLRFSPESSRWVAHEQWHPDQKGSFDEEGHFVLSFPFSHDRELAMDILRHGEHVEVLEPASLRAKIKEIATNVVRQY